MPRLVAVSILLLAAAGCTYRVPAPATLLQPTVVPAFQPMTAPAPGTEAPGVSILQPIPVQPVQVLYESRVFLPGTNYECLWETMADVVDDYFEVQHEEPVRLLGNVITEGRLETLPQVSATLFEPWRRDPSGASQRLESTLQSIRRYAQVRVLPGDGGFWVDVAVFKELENVIQPEFTTSGGATFRTDSSFVRVETPIGPQEVNCGWIPQGRDPLLEQEILAQLQLRYGTTH